MRFQGWMLPELLVSCSLNLVHSTFNFRGGYSVWYAVTLFTQKLPDLVREGYSDSKRLLSHVRIRSL
jgi:hypothetical protein